MTIFARRRVTFSQLLLVEQKIKHDPLGITSKTSPPKRSGSILATASEYYNQGSLAIFQ